MKKTTHAKARETLEENPASHVYAKGFYRDGGVRWFALRLDDGDLEFYEPDFGKWFLLRDSQHVCLGNPYV